MRKDRSVAMVVAIALLGAAWRAGASTSSLGFSPVATTRPTQANEALASASVAGRFRRIADEIAHAESISGPQADQAIILLTAAKRLSADVEAIEPLLLGLAIRNAEKDYSNQIVLWLQDYVNESADRTVINDAFQYLLDRRNSREERKSLLEELATKIGNRNAAVDSELATLLGLLMAEKADFEAAKFYLVQAYTNNQYNKVAFAKLGELAPEEINPSVYLAYLRLVVRENPLDIDAVLNFAQYTERLELYDVAAQSYRCCAELFRYLYPSEPLPPHVYLPWAISSYNTQRGQHVAMQIAETVRTRGRFDILLEAIAGRAAAKTGNPQEAQRIFRQAEQEAEQLLRSGPPQGPSPQGAMTPVRRLTPKQFAWFYCFADVNAQKALDWANRAYSVEPNSPSASALLAYALALNDQLEWAKPLLESAPNTQIVDLVRAQIQVAGADKAKAIQTLQVAISKDPGSLAAERARDMLGQLGSEYIPPVDTDVLMTYLTERLGKAVVPEFLPPDKIIQVQFTIRGNEFSYGSEIEGIVAIVNQGSDPPVVTDDGLFRGNIRIDARVSGDLKKEIRPLVSRTVRTAVTIPPGRSLVTPVRLSVGPLREVLVAHPQASLDIEFVLYLDPVVVESGAVSNRLVDLKPVTVSMTRPRVDLTGTYVRNRFNLISAGQEGQRIQTAQLFTGLLKEQYVMAEQGTLYPFKYSEWLPSLLRSALVGRSGLLLGGGEQQWVVRVNAMADMLSLPMDVELAGVVARNLTHSQWPVRLMAVYLLACGAGDNFTRVLDSVAQYDTNELVRSMAIALKSSQPAATTWGESTSAAPPAVPLP